MGGENLYLERISECVLAERKKRKMSQIKFYQHLFPGSNLSNESIKSYMNDIEKARKKKIDPDFLLALHERCNLGMDYVFGYEAEFPNHENENACKYTGLSIKTIELLHELALDVNSDIPSINECQNDDEWKRRCKLIDAKQGAEWILRIIEVLLTEDIEKHDGTYPNFKILFDLYMMAVMQPQKLNGVVVDSVEQDAGLLEISSNTKELYMDSLHMKDSFNFVHSINIDKVHQQIWKDQLIVDIERFIPVARKYFSDKIGSSANQEKTDCIRAHKTSENVLNTFVCE